MVIKSDMLSIRGDNMKQDSLFRLALVTHSSAPPTINKYISLLAKLSILQSKELYLDAYRIISLVKYHYDIEFSKSEIQYALYNDKDFLYDSAKETYSIKPEAIENIKELEKKYTPFEVILEKFINTFYKDLRNDSKEQIIDLIIRYIYYSFNEGKKSLISLLNNTQLEISEDFGATDEEKDIINKFIDWDNSEKNEEIAGIVSYCLDYGMITTRKDKTDIENLFINTKFYLDSNIIFRLVGLNNQERKKITNHFIEKCKEAEIEICYTNFTLEEIKHAIDKAVKYAQWVNGDSDKPLTPLDIDLIGDYENVDTYSIYYEWCCQKGNYFRSYGSYRKYLEDLLDKVLREFREEVVISERVGPDRSTFIDLAQNLKDYKDGRNPNRPCRIEAAYTDVDNFLFMKRKHDKKEKGQVINEFIISADRRFYDWCIRALPCVPIVFLPSEWLSILLKYTTRVTKEDYYTFTKLMNLRINTNGSDRDIIQKKIESINDLTSKTEVKQKIIHQISTGKISNKNIGWEKKIDDDIKKAFDNLLEQQKKDHQEKLQIKNNEQLKEINDIKDKHLREINEAIAEAFKTGKEAEALNRIDKKINWWKKYQGFKSEATVSIITFIILLIIVFNNNICEKLIGVCNGNEILKGREFEFALIFSGAVAVIVGIVIHYIIQYMSSEKRKSKLIYQLHNNT